MSREREREIETTYDYSASAFPARQSIRPGSRAIRTVRSSTLVGALLLVNNTLKPRILKNNILGLLVNKTLTVPNMKSLIHPAPTSIVNSLYECRAKLCEAYGTSKLQSSLLNFATDCPSRSLACLRVRPALCLSQPVRLGPHLLWALRQVLRVPFR